MGMTSKTFESFGCQQLFDCDKIEEDEPMCMLWTKSTNDYNATGLLIPEQRT